MILFQPAMAQAILEGCKTVTRRVWKRPRVRVGSEHLCYTRPAFARPPGRPFARIRILAVDRERSVMACQLGVWSDPAFLQSESEREGFPDFEAFRAAWCQMHGQYGLAHPCFRVEFELTESLA